MKEFFIKFLDIFDTIITFIKSLFSLLLKVFQIFPKIFNYLVSVFAVLPPFLSVFFIAVISILIIYKIINR